MEVAGEKGEWVLVALAGRAQPAWIERRHVQQVEGE
jgi:hypothetical protein